ncbi:MAG: TrmH family RNA methyltransferase [Urechidicola sp.]|jgi:TrmH family RNA methyltransferase
MLSKSQLKLITSLRQKKYRTKENLFIAEGVKVVNEFLNSGIKTHKIFCTTDFSHSLSEDIFQFISNEELKKISLLKTPNQVLGLFEIPEEKEIVKVGLTLVLDSISDPGNLGTIIRLSDWFGIHQIICSETTVDCYNPKVVMSTMGSLKRVSVKYADLKTYIKSTKLPVYAAMMNGENVYKTKLINEAILVMGNEANGISKEILDLITNQITIPRFGNKQETESLNVATATAILLSEFKRV